MWGFPFVVSKTYIIINFLLVYHTIGDFCFWGDPKWEIDTEVGKLDGSFAIMYILINRFKNNQDMNMSYEEFADLLKGNVEIPLLKERYNCLVEMNNYLDGIGKDFYDEIKDIASNGYGNYKNIEGINADLIVSGTVSASNIISITKAIFDYHIDNYY
mgnify:CR=1 FL=1